MLDNVKQLLKMINEIMNKLNSMSEQELLSYGQINLLISYQTV